VTTENRRTTIDRLLRLSRQTLLDRVDVLELAAIELLMTGGIDDAALAAARTTAHQLISLGTFGVKRGSALAREASELLLQEPIAADAGTLLAELALGIRTAITTAAEPVTEEPAPRITRPGTRVLIVEDDELMVSLLTRALLESGCEVTHVSDGLAAVERLSADDLPELILLDIDLPGLDGFSVLRNLRDRGLLKHTRVVVLSARGSEQDVLGTLELGASDHVTKPVSLPVLLARVKQLPGRT